MCHILFKQPDAVCVCFGGWFTATPQPLIAACVVETVPPLRLLTHQGSFPPDTMTTAGILALHCGKWRSSEKATLLYLLPSPPPPPLPSLLPPPPSLLPWLRQLAKQLPASQPSQQSVHLSVSCSGESIPTCICSCRGIQVPRDSAACACISCTAKSLGFYISTSLQLVVEIHKNLPQRMSSAFLSLGKKPTA